MDGLPSATTYRVPTGKIDNNWSELEDDSGQNKPGFALGDLPSATTCPVIAPGCALGDLPSATTYRVTEEENESIGNGNGKGEETGALEEERSVSDLHGPLEMRWRSPG